MNNHKEPILEKVDKPKENISLTSLKILESQKINNSPLLTIDIQLKENNIKKININSVDEIDDKINEFCKDNNISSNGKKYIKNILLQELNKKISKCKFHFI